MFLEYADGKIIEHEFPIEGSIVSYVRWATNPTGEETHYNKWCPLLQEQYEAFIQGRASKPFKILKIHDIVSAAGSSTYQKMWAVASADESIVSITPDKPDKASALELWISNFTSYKMQENTIGMKWEDEPREIWVKL